MKIRAARADEYEALTRLVLAAKSHWGYPASQLAAWADNLTVRQESLQRYPSFVAESEDGQLAGYAQVETDREDWELGALWVHPHFMRQGVGRGLISVATEFARGRGVPLLTIDSDPNAEAFYLSVGAQRVGEVPAPIAGQPNRVRPQLVLLTQAA